MEKLRVTVCVALISVATACNQSSQRSNTANSGNSPGSAAPAPAEEMSAVRMNFQRNCMGCHGENGEGGRVQANGKTLDVPSLRVGHALTHTDKDFVEQINEGGDGMPPFSDKLKPEEVADLVSFIRKEFQGR